MLTYCIDLLVFLLFVSFESTQFEGGHKKANYCHQIIEYFKR